MPVKHEAVHGIAVSDPLYGYIGVRNAPLNEEQLANFARVLNPDPLNGKYVMHLIDVYDPDVTALEVWHPRPFSPETVMEKLLVPLGKVIRAGLEELTVLPGCIEIAGSEPLFALYDQQFAVTDATQSD